MNAKILIFVLTAYFLSEVCVAKVYTWDTGLEECYGHKCPEDTVGCRKHSKLSKDKASINTEINCLGTKGESLDEFTEQDKVEPGSPFENVDDYESISYTGIVIFGRPIAESGETQQVTDTPKIQ